MKKILILLILLFAGTCLADGPYYVDNAASGANSGASWANAWESFADINWAAVAGGTNKTIYISGGTDTKTYNETLAPTSSGSEGSPIIIQVGQTEGHNGTVIIDANWTNNNGITLPNVAYITISGQVGSGTDQKIKVTKSKYSGVDVSGTSNNIDIGYIEITGCGDRTNVFGFRLTARANTNVISLHHSKIHDNFEEQLNVGYATDQNSQFDCIKIYNNEIYNFQGDALKITANGVSFYNNLVHDRLTAKTDYSDGIQMWGSWTKIYNNKFYNIIRDYNTSQPAAWTASTGYKAGDCVSPTGANATKRYWCSTAAGTITSGDTEPNWEVDCPTNGDTCTEAVSGITWKNKMGFANDDSTYWPSHWASNSHIRYNPDTAAYAAAQYVYIYNNLFVEADSPLCANSNLTGVTFSFSDVNPTSVANMIFANNTLVGIPSYGLYIISEKHSSGSAKVISGATKANPVVITSTAHGYSNGDRVWINSVAGMTQLNTNNYTVANKTDNTYELSGIDGSAYSDYVSGGYGYLQTLTHSTVSNILVKNNIFKNIAKDGWTTSVLPLGTGDGTITFGDHGSGEDIEADYNLIYAEEGFNTGKTYNGSNDLAVDPGIGSDYKATSISSAIVGSGISMATYYTDDYDGGSARSAWDIGAYEYTAGTTYPSVSIGSGAAMSIGAGGATATLY